jgi:hypothetical protein
LAGRIAHPLFYFSRFCLLTKHLSVSQKQTAHAKQLAWVSNYYLILSGRWLGQILLEHLSGIVFVPSIMSDWQRGQIFPVGLALIAFLHLG